MYRATHHGTHDFRCHAKVVPTFYATQRARAEAERTAGKLVDAVPHGTPSTPEEEEPGDEAAAAGDTKSPSKRVKIHHSA